MKRRAVITSAGIVGPMALDSHQFWDLIREGRSAIRKISRFDSSPTGCHIGGEVPDFPLNFIPAHFKPKRQARHTHLLLKAAEQIRGGLPQGGCFNLRIGLATSDLSMVAESGVKRARGGFENACPMMISQCSPHSAAGALSMYLACQGEVSTVLDRLRSRNGCRGTSSTRRGSGHVEFCCCGRGRLSNWTESLG